MSSGSMRPSHSCGGSPVPAGEGGTGCAPGVLGLGPFMWDGGRGAPKPDGTVSSIASVGEVGRARDLCFVEPIREIGRVVARSFSRDGHVLRGSYAKCRVHNFVPEYACTFLIFGGTESYVLPAPRLESVLRVAYFAM